VPRRKDFSRRTVTRFKKTYGPWVYVFSHEVTEIPGFTTALTTVRRKEKKDASPYRVGELVHCFTWQKEN
jgi:hypothetical protein